MNPSRYLTFAGAHCVGHGSLQDAAVAAKRAASDDPTRPVLTFDMASGRVVDLDLRGGFAEVSARYAAAEPPAEAPKRGRPKLGVVAREVTLLPRHWEWLAGQPGGASAALRRMIDQARKTDDPAGRRQAQREAAYRFMSAMAGNRPHFEEASRALFRDDMESFVRHTDGWPPDVRMALIERLKAEPEIPAHA